MPISGRARMRVPGGGVFWSLGTELTAMSVTSISPASYASSAAFWSPIGRMWTSSKSGRGPFQAGFRASTMRSLGRHSLRRYGPDVAGGSVLYDPPTDSTAFFDTMVPAERVRVPRNRPGNGALRTITPVYLSTTSTRSSSFQSGALLDLSFGSTIRSKEYFTSSAVISPNPLVHMMPGRSVNLTWVASTCSIDWAASGRHSHRSPDLYTTSLLRTPMMAQMSVRLRVMTGSRLTRSLAMRTRRIRCPCAVTTTGAPASIAAAAVPCNIERREICRGVIVVLPCSLRCRPVGRPLRCTGPCHRPRRIEAPVTRLARRPARNATTAAISSGSAMRRRGAPSPGRSPSHPGGPH